MADAVINDLKMKAKSKGGDSIANILFEKRRSLYFELPVCEKQLGWSFSYIFSLVLGTMGTSCKCKSRSRTL